MCGSDVFLGILAVFFPPIAVWIKVGLCTADSIINLALCCLGYLPGLLHSWYIILKNPEPDYDDPEGYAPLPSSDGRGRDIENGRVTYYYVSRNAHAQGPAQRNRVYGTNDQVGGTKHASQQPQQGPDANGEGSSGGEARPPPTYAEAVKGDNKVQTDE
ncbi:hypothetical protein FQN54_006094 [Arachnomyces sp. PD_36]|nr:hypothetical protein FQN54_006094 [Arachnomyces sp. PD_36]